MRSRYFDDQTVIELAALLGISVPEPVKSRQASIRTMINRSRKNGPVVSIDPLTGNRSAIK